MTQDIADRLVTISNSEIKGFVQQNYGSVTFVYNFPQGADAGAALKAAGAAAAAPACPYRGLSAFQPEDARFFFGREAAIDRVSRLVARGQITAVTGASGSGKSSLVFAGVVPALAAGNQWLFATFRPGADPFYALAGALVPVLAATSPAGAEPASEQTQAIASLAAALREDATKLLATRQEISHLYPGRQLLLIADQFEELYTLCQKPEVRKQFLDSLLAATAGATAAGAPSLRVLLTVRADFLGALVSHRGLADALQNQIDLLGPMTRAELMAAVVKPAELMGVRYEDHLVERILDDLGDDDGSLPLLEFALTQLWEQQSADRLLTHTEYEKIGRVSGAIQQHAEAAYARLDVQERARTRRLFRRLVSLSGSDAGPGQRRTRQPPPGGRQPCGGSA
jgi:energy-coupling factor transporter ATP-binding protein EcfA2